ncbi:MAG: hypothetical protein HY735_09405 [Verrucomicrobia bacterium]|nr:hypothetical protein [Verrucomicrobiota bacterium]
MVSTLQAYPAVDPASFETRFIRFQLSPENGSYEILDKRANVTWRSNPFRQRFGEIILKADGSSQRLNLDQCQVARLENGLQATFRPWAEKPDVRMRVRIVSAQNEATLALNYEFSDGLEVEAVRLLDEALWVADSEQGYSVVPVREGLLVPADNGVAFTHRFDTSAYEGCHMEMFGVVKNGATALVTWEDPYVAVELKSVLTNRASGGGAFNSTHPVPLPGGDLKSAAGSGSQSLVKQILSPSLVLSKTARAIRIHFGDRGDYVTLAKQYRQVAAEKGYLVRWPEKIRNHPARGKLIGAINYKLWSTLDRRMNEASSQEESVRVNWTFEEAAQIAEHLRNDLRLEKVLFIMGGWIRRGYDNQHPDILPAASECGGNEALADCAQRIRRLGYLFCLHDNYQDMYRDAPSWDESFLMKRPDGSLAAGGKWAGGRAYLTCSQKAVELALRPQNLPAIRQLTRADAYFIDTTYAAGLMECFDAKHPLTRVDDLFWKQRISDEARELFGIFGSECGREWAVPHSDFFEGLTGVSGRHYHDANLVSKLGARVIPLFEMVYRDCIALYGKYGYNPSQAAEYVLHHLVIGRPLHYHNIPAHLYWKAESAGSRPAPSPNAADVFTRANNGWAEGLHVVDRFVKNTYEILSPLNELTAELPLSQHEFLSADHKVQRSVFGEGKAAVEVVVNAGADNYEHRTQSGQSVELPRYGFCIESPTFAAFHALSQNRRRYEAPAFFTLRSQDGKPLEQSASIRIFHGFGDEKIELHGKTWAIQKEARLERRDGQEILRLESTSSAEPAGFKQ